MRPPSFPYLLLGLRPQRPVRRAVSGTQSPQLTLSHLADATDAIFGVFAQYAGKAPSTLRREVAGGRGIARLLAETEQEEINHKIGYKRMV